MQGKKNDAQQTGGRITAKAAHAHKRTIIMSFKVIRATAPELFKWAGHPTHDMLGAQIRPVFSLLDLAGMPRMVRHWPATTPPLQVVGDCLLLVPIGVGVGIGIGIDSDSDTDSDPDHDPYRDRDAFVLY
jgi:hypothetical protein